MSDESQTSSIVDAAVAEGSAYEVIRKRLVDQGEILFAKTSALNTARAEEFGSTEMEVLGRTRVRTENNCRGRDIVQVGELLLFGYNVFIGLKKTTRVEDVFALYRLQAADDKYSMEPVSLEDSFLADKRFRADFDELYHYYKETRLIQLMKANGKLLAGFQIGERLDDTRVFRWAVSEDGGDVSYIDNRGERDLELPQPYDFEWVRAEREDVVHGRFPHISLDDEVFIETINGDLTIKVENNTEDGEGVYSEPVEDVTQSLDDAEIAYARIGDLILIKVLPYKERKWRHLVFNRRTQSVVRIDEIGNSCVQLPEDHGIIFPGGYYLESGDYKMFGTDVTGFKFKRKIRSPIGEDVLYVFYEPVEGRKALLSYNLIEKSLQNPIISNGYALAENGQVVVFNADPEPTRVHPMQIWKTPYVHDEYAAAIPTKRSFYANIGNAELVRGVSDLFSLHRAIRTETVSVGHYEKLLKTADRLFDDHFWISEEATGGIGETVRSINETVELIVDEFEKVESIQRQSAAAVREAISAHTKIIATSESAAFRAVEEFVSALDRIRKQRGHLATIREYRYIDTEQIDAMDAELVELNAVVGARTAEFLADENSLDSYIEDIDKIRSEIGQLETVAAVEPRLQSLEEIASGLDLLSELTATLKIDDATVQTRITSSISSVYSRLNQSRALGRQHKEKLSSTETVEQFAAQLELFSQTIISALGLATTPMRCDEQLSKLLIHLEEMESRFGGQEQFLNEIMSKRDEVHDTLESHKQRLLDAQNTRAQTLSDAVNRMLDNVEKRANRFETNDELNTYLASDALVLKIRDLVGQLRELDSAVKADDAEARLKMIRDQALRSLRDKADLYADGGDVIKLGPRHRFSVSKEELDLTIIPRNEGLALHLVGTQYFERIQEPELDALKPFWGLAIESESEDVPRAEYLAYCIIEAARKGTDSLDWQSLTAAVSKKATLEKLVQEFSAPRYRDGYERGVHDADACSLLRKLVPAIDGADLLRFDPESRGFAQLVWANINTADDAAQGSEQQKTLVERAQSAQCMHEVFGNLRGLELIEEELGGYVSSFIEQYAFDIETSVSNRAVRYLVSELGRETVAFIGTSQATKLLGVFKKSVRPEVHAELQRSVANLAGAPDEQWKLVKAWLNAMLESSGDTQMRHYVPEAAAQLITGRQLARRKSSFDAEISIDGLFSEHGSIVGGTLEFSLDSFLNRLHDHTNRVVPSYRRYRRLRRDIAERSREELQLDEFKPRPLSSFVRNKLINDAYLPLIGDNLAKQIGTAGDTRRSDLSGLLMMISPPGYGKTTLMEYVASRLGLTFMKVNCPALGHDVDSLDPANAPNATAKRELEKVNLAFEMGDNVMLYLDDIQHCAAGFLQRFISLCDSTRRVEGVWKGRTRTYDLRGRKFCVVMAGNPYTESGETFKVPDMLANRADIYNLGDILSGKERQFELSYLENCLTSNAVLAPLATRDMDDVYKFIDGAKGHAVASTELSHAYSSAEISEITRLFGRLLLVQDVVLKVNQQYIASAAQEDKYRVEPRFLLQGSYRNMNKLAEKVSAVMSDTELQQLIDDHYRGEAQLLTQGTEANLLKLAELRGMLDDDQAARWAQIKKDFLRNKSFGGDEADAGQRIAAQLADLVEGLSTLGSELKPNGAAEMDRKARASSAKLISRSLEKLGEAVSNQKTTVSVTNKPSKEFADTLSALNETIRHTLFPLVRSMDKRIALDIAARDKLRKLAQDVEALKKGDLSE
ncbi:MAG: DNA repair ATPase [Gammaproteobacteria bacterium]|nr:DNA repair ATPase [Gammaproteobacteria bacterium]